MELRHPFLEVCVHLLVLVKPLAEHGIVDRLTAGQHKPRVVLSDFHDELRSGLVEVVHLHPSEQVSPAHGCKDYPVLYLNVADLPWREQRLKSLFHCFQPLPFRLRRHESCRLPLRSQGIRHPGHPPGRSDARTSYMSAPRLLLPAYRLFC